MDTLICFAVREEAAPFLAIGGGRHPNVITGMGRRNAARAIERALAERSPARVITAGFAGGLNPRLRRGTVVFDLDEGFDGRSRLIELGAVEGAFHCAPRVAVTANAKKSLFQETDADAVEMESQVIREHCRRRGVPSATIRVISDAADEDLPLDFNAMMTDSDRIDWLRFAGTLVLRPMLVGKLIGFQKTARQAAGRLARVLAGLVGDESGGTPVQGVP